MQQEHDADQSDNHAFLNERAFQSFDSSMDQVGTVIDRDNFDILGQARFHVIKTGLNIVDHLQRILSKALQAMPLATSPSPLSSVMPRRSSGPSSIRAMSFKVTGVPFSTLSTTSERSSTLFK